MTRVMTVAVLALATTGCDPVPTEVVLRGTVLAGHDASSGPLVDGEITVRDDAGDVYARARTDSGGAFSVRAPAGYTVFADVFASGFVEASFLGVTGAQDRQKVEDGALYGFSLEELASWEADMAGCPGLGTEGAVLGDVRVFNLEDPETGDHPLVATARVQVRASDGTIWTACYLDDEGVAVDPAAEQTGDSGRFAVFGLPAGVHTLTVSYAVVEGAGLLVEDYPVHVPANGVAPRFPAWVHFDL